MALCVFEARAYRYRWCWTISLQAKRLSVFSINTPRFGLSIFPQRSAMQRTWRESVSFPSPLKRAGCPSDLNSTRTFLAMLKSYFGRPVTMSTPYLPSNWEGAQIHGCLAPPKQRREFLSHSISISPISASIPPQVTMESGYCVHTRKVSKTRWRCCDPRCGFLKLNLPKGGCGSSNLNGFGFMNS